MGNHTSCSSESDLNHLKTQRSSIRIIFRSQTADPSHFSLTAKGKWPLCNCYNHLADPPSKTSIAAYTLLRWASTDSLYATAVIVNLPEAIACGAKVISLLRCWSQGWAGDGAGSPTLVVYLHSGLHTSLEFGAKSDEPFKRGGRMPEPQHSVDMKPALGLLPAIWLSQSVLALLVQCWVRERESLLK